MIKTIEVEVEVLTEPSFTVRETSTGKDLTDRLPLKILRMLADDLKSEDEHECDDEKRVDCDICQDCGEHSGFCSQCGLSTCCGSGSYQMD